MGESVDCGGISVTHGKMEEKGQRGLKYANILYCLLMKHVRWVRVFVTVCIRVISMCKFFVSACVYFGVSDVTCVGCVNAIP